MPELPEVETVRRIISPQIEGCVIGAITINHPQVIKHPEAGVFCDAVKGRAIVGTDRRGKFLKIALDNGAVIVLHLRMTGQFLVTPADFPVEKHTHVIFQLDSGRQLRYIDTRRFGGFWLIAKDEPDDVTCMPKLGLEPFDPALTAAYLQGKAGGSRRAIKNMLLDQTIVTGIGNIYSDEILFRTKIHPQRACRDLSYTEWQALAESIPCIINWGIETNAVTAEEHLAGKGKKYRNTPYLQAYGHAGKPCPRCDTPFKKVSVGGRSSCYCPHCQGEIEGAPAAEKDKRKDTPAPIKG